jgi:glycosyltransferase involved in cell wall biosynthesis
MSYTLSVVIPVYNEAPHLAATVDRLKEAIERSGYDAELIVVDDGSQDGSAESARVAVDARFPLTILQQPNRGRFHAVRAGLERATGRYVLVLGSRVRLRPDALKFVRERERAGETVWTGHVYIHTDGNPYGTFMNVLTEIAWRHYFDNPRTTSFGLRDFDRYPKGSGCFFAPRALLVDAFAAVPTRYADVRHANDDAPMLRRVARSAEIHISPSFASDYVPRGSLRTFINHSVHRGMVFLDGHGRRESRFFPYVVAFYPISAGVVIASAYRLRALPIAVATAALGAATVAASYRRSRNEVATVAVLTPVWLLALGTGLWRGLGMLAAGRLWRRKGVQWS